VTFTICVISLIHTFYDIVWLLCCCWYIVHLLFILHSHIQWLLTDIWPFSVWLHPSTLWFPLMIFDWPVLHWLTQWYSVHLFLCSVCLILFCVILLYIYITFHLLILHLHLLHFIFIPFIHFYFVILPFNYSIQFWRRKHFHCCWRCYPQCYFVCPNLLTHIVLVPLTPICCCYSFDCYYDCCYSIVYLLILDIHWSDIVILIPHCVIDGSWFIVIYCWRWRWYFICYIDVLLFIDVVICWRDVYSPDWWYYCYSIYWPEVDIYLMLLYCQFHVTLLLLPHIIWWLLYLLTLFVIPIVNFIDCLLVVVCVDSLTPVSEFVVIVTLCIVDYSSPTYSRWWYIPWYSRYYLLFNLMVVIDRFVDLNHCYCYDDYIVGIVEGRMLCYCYLLLLSDLLILVTPIWIWPCCCCDITVVWWRVQWWWWWPHCIVIGNPISSVLLWFDDDYCDDIHCVIWLCLIPGRWWLVFVCDVCWLTPFPHYLHCVITVNIVIHWHCLMVLLFSWIILLLVLLTLFDDVDQFVVVVTFDVSVDVVIYCDSDIWYWPGYPWHCIYDGMMMNPTMMTPLLTPIVYLWPHWPHYWLTTLVTL